ncbi:MAG: efflux RND transporter periplasmic adaptor subunit [Kiritimatiellae bacterium]|nr:efflux RND transporter periplasmic adaptor subunit [Kiritimatiellia bacterium]
MASNEEKKSMATAVGSAIATFVLAVVCAAGGWIGHGMWAERQEAEAPKKPVVPPATVAVTNAQMRVYNLPESFVAHAEAMQEVDLLPQVDGYIREMLFKEGDIVKEGDVLYVLDDERYQAVVNQRKADLEAAEAEERRARRYWERMEKADARGITQLERDNAEAAAESAKARVLQAKANLVVAEYDLKKAKVVAPIGGQIGKSAAHVGDYVAPSKGALARIVQIDPIRVTFPLTDRAYIAWREAQKEGTATDYRMRLVLADGSAYEQDGAWDFDDNQMSRDTATIQMRLKFPNPERLLIPNSYVTLVTDNKNPPSYPSVPQTAFFDLPGGNLGVYVVKNGVAEARPVETLGVYDGWRAVKSGLAEGETVVISGTGKIVPGGKVNLGVATPNDDTNPGFKPTLPEK